MSSIQKKIGIKVVFKKKLLPNIKLQIVRDNQGFWSKYLSSQPFGVLRLKTFLTFTLCSIGWKVLSNFPYETGKFQLGFCTQTCLGLICVTKAHCGIASKALFPQKLAHSMQEQSWFPDIIPKTACMRNVPRYHLQTNYDLYVLRNQEKLFSLSGR